MHEPDAAQQPSLPLDLEDARGAGVTVPEETGRAPGGTGSSWDRAPRAAFDLETTGRDPRTARIVTASIVAVDAEGVLSRHWEWLVDPGVPIPAGATEVHGITTEHAREHGMPAQRAVTEISERLRELFGLGPVMAFNAPYDFTVLEVESRRHGVPSIDPAPVLDPLVMDRAVDRYRRGKRTLGAMTEHYGVTLENAHTSAADALATIHVADALARAFPEDLRIEVDELHARQIEWQRAWAAGFQEYLRRRDPSAVVSAAWPRAAL